MSHLLHDIGIKRLARSPCTAAGVAAGYNERARVVLAFGMAVPIAMLGGLIGLGGAEFRLPVLAGVLKFSARQAVALNLSISLVTVATSLLIREWSVDFDDLRLLREPMAAMAIGAAITAFIGPSFAKRLSSESLERTILMLLLGIGVALIVGALFPSSSDALLPDDYWIVAAFVLGLGIGLVSSLLGVAGGEMIIPSFVFLFGAPVKIAGTASLAVSLPTVAVGVMRYWRQGYYSDHAALAEVIGPMAVGSVIGGVTGALLVGVVSASAIKLVLGVILILSAIRVFAKSKEATPAAFESGAQPRP